MHIRAICHANSLLSLSPLQKIGDQWHRNKLIPKSFASCMQNDLSPNYHIKHRIWSPWLAGSLDAMIGAVDIGAMRWHLLHRSMALPVAALLGRFLP
jgi:hypothetical protein